MHRNSFWLQKTAATFLMHKFLWSGSWKRVTRHVFCFLDWDFSCELWPSSRCFLYRMIRKQYLAEPMGYNSYPSPGGWSFCITSWHLNSFVACQGSTRECSSDKGSHLYDFYGLYGLRILCPILVIPNTVGSFDMILKNWAFLEDEPMGLFPGGLNHFLLKL